jgi:metal-responsive CopG/Arc/MetJ family transcriptional regulator
MLGTPPYTFADSMLYRFRVYLRTPAKGSKRMSEEHSIAPESFLDHSKFREIGITTKLTQKEVERLEELTQRSEISRSEFIRNLILQAIEKAETKPEPSPEMVEIIGLRLMLTNFLKPIAHGKTQTKEEIDVLMNTIRERKKPLAQEIIDGAKG